MMGNRGWTLLMIFTAISATGGSCPASRQIVTSLANAPTQTVLASVATQEPLGDGVPVITFVSAQEAGGTFTMGRVEGDGGLLVTERARPGTSPGIAANMSVYVIAYWGGRPGFNALHLFVSEDGQQWSRAGSHLLASASQIDDEARPSITFFPSTSTWFVAFRDGASGTIKIAQFAVACVSSAGQCQQDGRGVTRYTSNWVGGTLADTGLATPKAPALSYVGNTMVVVFAVPAAQGPTPLQLAASTSGVMFTAPVPILSGGSAVTSIGAPYLNHSATGDVFLATGVEGPGPGQVNLTIFGPSPAPASPAVVFPLLSTTPRVASAFAGGARFDPAIAGTGSEMTMAFRADAGNGTTVISPSGTLTLQTLTNRGVGLTRGRRSQ